MLDNVSKIDIHSDNPLGETFKTISGVATDLKTFVQNNKDQLTEDLTSPLTAKINSAQGAIKIAFSEEAREHFPDIEKAISFSFGIKHAGDSIIRAKDGQYYYFTTRSHEMETDETAGKAEQTIMAWTANYNGAEADEDNKGLTNTTVSTTDWEIWKSLLTVIATDVSSVTIPNIYRGPHPS